MSARLQSSMTRSPSTPLENTSRYDVSQNEDNKMRVFKNELLVGYNFDFKYISSFHIGVFPSCGCSTKMFLKALDMIRD